jgi:hypothetical protein
MRDELIPERRAHGAPRSRGVGACSSTVPQNSPPSRQARQDAPRTFLEVTYSRRERTAVVLEHERTPKSPWRSLGVLGGLAVISGLEHARTFSRVWALLQNSPPGTVPVLGGLTVSSDLERARTSVAIGCRALTSAPRPARASPASASPRCESRGSRARRAPRGLRLGPCAGPGRAHRRAAPPNRDRRPAS